MKPILPITFIVFLILFLVLSSLFPKYAKEMVTKKTQVDVIKQEKKVLPALESSLASKTDDFAKIEKAFPSKKDLVFVPLAIEQLAQQTGVVAELHFEGETAVADRNGDMYVPVIITIKGNYENVTSFLEQLAHGRYFFTMQSLSGDMPGGLEKDNTVIVRANLYIAKGL
jgi:Tfp pilus assembly protein PilO